MTELPTSWRDACLEMEQRVREKYPNILVSALRECIELHAPQFRKRGADLVHVEIGDKLERWIDELPEHHPHYFPNTSPDLLEQAFVLGNLTARGKVIKQEGRARYLEVAKVWSADPNDPRIPGKRPGSQSADDRPEVKDRSNNPWLPEAWNVSKQGSIVKAMGIEKAAAIARTAGSYIGATKPNADYALKS